PGFHLPQLNGLADGIAADEAEPTVIELTYHDTRDLRLARAGVTLLYRGDDGWVVTLGRETATGPELRHDEHRFEGAAGPPPSAGDVIRNALAASVARLIAHDPGVRLGDDPEDVHQARVATRRLRSDLRTFHSLLDADWTQALRQDLKSIGRDLGAVRDTEVL